MKTANEIRFHIDSNRLKDRLTEISAFGKNPERGISRLGFSEADVNARAWVIAKMRDAGLEVWVDAAANIHGRRAGKEPDLSFFSALTSTRCPKVGSSTERSEAWALSKS